MDETNQNNLKEDSAIQSQKNAVIEALDLSTRSKKQIDEIEQGLRRNKVIFFGYPIFVILFSFAIVFFFVVPAVQDYFRIESEKKIIDQNLENFKKTAQNLNYANEQIGLYSAYEVQLFSYIPVEARVGQLIDTIQKKANDFGLEKPEIAASNTSQGRNFTTINNLTRLDSNNNALFQSLNSGEIEFYPKNVSEDAKAKLLSIDVEVKGKKENLLRFLESVKTIRPVINLVSIEYKEITQLEGQPDVIASLKFESYSLNLNLDKSRYTLKSYTVDDPSLSSIIPVETFDINQEIKDKIETTIISPTFTN